jgi:FkbM family methyltransferase
MEQYLQNINIPQDITHVKIDVGLSYNANQSQDWLSNEKNLFVFGFEPNPQSVENILNGNIKKRDPSHGQSISNEYINKTFTIIPVALSKVEEPTIMDFYSMSKDTGTSSLYQPVDPNLGPIKEKIQVPVYSLKHFFDLFPWDRFEYIDYIKIDAQGADFDIIQSAGDYLKERVVYITAEPESNQYNDCNHNTTGNMEKYLITQNFIRINHPHTNDPTFINQKFLDLQDKIYIRQV